MKRIYRTFQGREVDMDQLLQKNETMPAVGNIRVNARGDELGPDGKVIKTREEVLSEYYDEDPNLVSDDEISLTKVKIARKNQVVLEKTTEKSATTDLAEQIVRQKNKEIK